MKVDVIGLGAMGLPMAAALARDGYDATAHDLNPGGPHLHRRVHQLAQQGPARQPPATHVAPLVLNLVGIAGGPPRRSRRTASGCGGRRLSATASQPGGLILVGLTRETVSIYLQALLVGLFVFGHSFGPGSQGKTMAALSCPTNLRATGRTESMPGLLLLIHREPIGQDVEGELQVPASAGPSRDLCSATKDDEFLRKDVGAWG